MINLYKLFVLFLMIPFFLTVNTFAQSEKKGKPKRTTISFEDQLIKGEKQMPDLLYMLRKKRFNYKRLIRLREDFIPEMEETGTEIKESVKTEEK